MGTVTTVWHEGTRREADVRVLAVAGLSNHTIICVITNRITVDGDV
jgi:hypothetical protein